MSWLSSLFGDREPDRDIPAPDPRLFGSVILLVGQPGTGKTHLGFRLALRSGFINSLPLVIQDTRGDLSVYLSTIKRTLALSDKKIDRAKLAYISDTKRVRLISRLETNVFLGYIEHFRKKALKVKYRKPEMVCFIDEAGVLRRNEEDFWDIASGFRNAGIHAYTTAHKDTDVSRVGRQTLRAVVLYRPYEKEVEFFGVTIPAMECTPPMATRVTYIDSYERVLKQWDTEREWDDIPDTLIEPVQPTNVKSMRF